ncbi:outer membrane lipoprotein chaperone LolA [Beggiatoa leptomitoformis]|uniref:Outer-membrane lipoprotein carrier protein n=1 Tax=Beggiatoa leptomitoformis TaxID=288004 RepID=A0A2N9YA65_9GAMM|nr:outer membrane lipoprotein chaperone LolA [Beggiatoa leptomitoformis]ALG67228.2 outer membrane lipoprotein chaperone LolA [Beggiatoa leptomitoformis]AUI67358.1 outer membrane lipoprotein chaperone LolA [Beggiatoa leptomitoformis]
MRTNYYWFVILLLLSQSLKADDALDAFLNNFKTLHAEFTQVLYAENGELLQSSSGEMYIKRPGKFRWFYKSPYEQLIIADGERVWIHDADLEQVTVKALDKALGQTPALLLTSETNVNENFTVKRLSATSGIIVLEIRPKGEQPQFEKLILTLENDTLQKLELQDNLGQKSLISFSKMQKNLTVDEDLFIFTPPAGTDIIKDM